MPSPPPLAIWTKNTLLFLSLLFFAIYYYYLLPVLALTKLKAHGGQKLLLVHFYVHCIYYISLTSTCYICLLMVEEIIENEARSNMPLFKWSLQYLAIDLNFFP